MIFKKEIYFFRKVYYYFKGEERANYLRYPEQEEQVREEKGCE